MERPVFTVFREAVKGGDERIGRLAVHLLTLVEFRSLVYDIASLDKMSLKAISDHAVLFLVLFRERKRTKNGSC